jgi:hypothetical protein
MGDIMTKEQFIKRMSLIQNFDSERDTLGVLIDKLTDGYTIVTFGDYLSSEMIDMITEDCKCDDKELLSWWLYETVEKVIWIDDKEISVKTLDELWDYINNTYLL